MLTGAAKSSRNRTLTVTESPCARKLAGRVAVNLLFTLSGRGRGAVVHFMDGLFLIFLLLGAAPDGAPVEAPRSQSRVQAVASATILRGEVIDFGAATSARNGDTGKDDRNVFRIATIRSAGKIDSVDGGGEVRLQEFH